MRLGLSGWLAVALASGVLFGLFLGEPAGALAVLGDAYVGLLQMTVLPYIVLSLVGGIGGLRRDQARKLGGTAFAVLVGLWSLGLAAVAITALVFPAVRSPSFFSTSLIDTPPPFDFLGLFVPANPFQSLAEGRVPAVVLFCILTGVAVVGLDDKQELLRLVDLLSRTMSRVTRHVVTASPVGVFFITAAAAGTITLAEVGRLQGYIIAYTLAAAALGFVGLPALGSALTPFGFRELSRISRGAFLLAFATGKALVVVPMLIEEAKALFRASGHGSEETDAAVEVLIPLGFPFPHLGRLLTTVFIPFAAWYLGSPIAAGQYPTLLSVAFFGHFASSSVSIPFLLDFMRLPADMFHLFVMTSMYIDRLSNGLAAIYLLVFAVLTATALHLGLRPQWRRLGELTVGASLCALIGIPGLRSYLASQSHGSFDKSEVLASMHLIESPMPSVVQDPSPNPIPLRLDQSHLDRIRQRAVLRVGFVPDALPFSYFNVNEELVGFDIDLMHRLAHELGVSVEFVPIEGTQRFAEQLARDHFDIAVGGIAGTIERSQETRFSDPYLFVTMAFVVPDHRGSEFETLEAIARMNELTIGVTTRG